MYGTCNSGSKGMLIAEFEKTAFRTMQDLSVLAS